MWWSCFLDVCCPQLDQYAWCRQDMWFFTCFWSNTPRASPPEKWKWFCCGSGKSGTHASLLLKWKIVNHFHVRAIMEPKSDGRQLHVHHHSIELEVPIQFGFWFLYDSFFIRYMHVRCSLNMSSDAYQLVTKWKLNNSRRHHHPYVCANLVVLIMKSICAVVVTKASLL